MKTVLPSACVWLGGALLAAASALFWYIILTPDLPLRAYTIATVLLFATGILLVTLTPLVVAARATASASPRSRVSSSPEIGSRAAQLVAKLLIWLILASYVAISLVG